MRPPSHLLHHLKHDNDDDTSLRLGSGHIGIGTYIASSTTSIYSWFFNTTTSSRDSLGGGDGDDDNDDDGSDGGSVSKAVVDNSCMQSREVWTGTTYALAAAMIHESYYDVDGDGGRGNDDCNNNDDDDDGDRGYHSKGGLLTVEERIRLRSMAFNTSRGA